METYDSNILERASARSGRGKATPARILRAARIAIAAMSCACMFACVRHYQVHDPAELVGQDLIVELDDGSIVEARLETTPHGHVWRTESGTEIAAERVRVATTTMRGEGAVLGLVVGAGAGAALGGVVGLTRGDDPECGDNEFLCVSLEAGEKAVLGAVVVGVVGGVTGLVLGSSGVHKRYELPPERVVPRISARPIRGGASASLAWSF